MTAVILQARLDSSRLPGKSLLLLQGRPLVFRVMEALNRVAADLRVLACPEDSAAAFAPLAEEARFELFPGPKEDVLRRYGMAIRRFAVDRVIRATGDNPFVFADAALSIQGEGERLDADYGGYGGIPHGAGVESVKSEALLRAEREAELPLEREHVCPYLYNHPERFLIHRPLAPRNWQAPSLRLTVDTPEDLARAQGLYGALSQSAAGDERYRGERIIQTARRFFEGESFFSESPAPRARTP